MRRREDQVIEEAEAELGWAQVSLQPWHSEPPGSEARLPRDLWEPTTQREALLEEQDAAANSKLFALHQLPGAQAPFLVNILDERSRTTALLLRDALACHPGSTTGGDEL